VITIRIGYELDYVCAQPTPMVLTLHVHSSRVPDLVAPDHLITTPAVPSTAYRDTFGNWCSRIVAPPGPIRLSTDTFIRDSGVPDQRAPFAHQHAVEDLPGETLQFLLGSRYCETDRLTEAAWDLFDRAPLGAARVQAICDYVHGHVHFGYQHAGATKTAWDVFHDGVGVCRDYAHLAVTLCRCMNIPARYCTGYLSDIGVPEPHGPGDFAAWFEAYLDGRWHTYDPRNNKPHIGRILMARGRDAADVAISNTFGPNELVSFRVWTDPA